MLLFQVIDIKGLDTAIILAILFESHKFLDTLSENPKIVTDNIILEQDVFSMEKLAHLEKVHITQTNEEDMTFVIVDGSKRIWASSTSSITLQEMGMLKEFSPRWKIHLNPQKSVDNVSNLPYSHSFFLRKH